MQVQQFATQAYVPTTPYGYFSANTPPVFPSALTSYQRVLPVSILPFRLENADSVLAVAPQTPAQQPAVDQFLQWVNATYLPLNGSDIMGTGLSFIDPQFKQLYIPSLASKVSNHQPTNQPACLLDYLFAY